MRQRPLKPSFFKNEVIASCPPLTRLLFQGLWGMADREGRLEDRPDRIKVEVLPYDDYDADTGLSELFSKSLIIRYEVSGLRLIWIPSFKRNAAVCGSEAQSELPAYQEDAQHSLPLPSLFVNIRREIDPDIKGKGYRGSVVVAVGGCGGGNGSDRDQNDPETCETCDLILNGPGGLNTILGSRFRPKGEGGRFLHARHKEYSSDDCLRVIRVKVQKWRGRTWTDSRGKEVRGVDYLRLSTLFRPGNFNEYVNEPERQDPAETARLEVERANRVIAAAASTAKAT